jgi:hypothetical protein
MFGVSSKRNRWRRYFSMMLVMSSGQILADLPFNYLQSGQLHSCDVNVFGQLILFLCSLSTSVIAAATLDQVFAKMDDTAKGFHSIECDLEQTK